jgi:hypothetical protein
MECRGAGRAYPLEESAADFRDTSIHHLVLRSS